MEKTEGAILGSFFVLLGLLTIVHHVIVSGRLFDIRDILHHEFFEAIFFTAGIVLLLITMLNRK